MVCGSGSDRPERPRVWAASVPLDGAAARSFRWADFRPSPQASTRSFLRMLRSVAVIMQVRQVFGQLRAAQVEHVLMADGAVVF